MPVLSFTDLVDVVSRVGPRKVTALSRIKNRPEYHPAFDYYRRVREHIVCTHQNDCGKEGIEPPEQLTTDRKKWDNYAAIIRGYKQFWGRKKIGWFAPPRKCWHSNDIEVHINPELGLMLNDTPHVVKLYFKADELSKAKVDLSLFLMSEFLPKKRMKADIIYSEKEGNFVKYYLNTTVFHEVVSFFMNIMKK